jgi:hypothetical protein
MDCIEVVWMTLSINRSRHQLGALGWLLGLLGSIFHGKKEYFSRYNASTYNLMFYLGLGRREWLDRVEWVQMTTSELGRCSQLGLGFAAGLAALCFS